MDIDTDKPPPKPIEECLENIKEIAFMVNDIKTDMLFIKSKIKEAEDKKGKVEIEKSWWLF
tara:strand:- start:165 stop:347 length:183 start_codon:yes stop_codon:yes gene_type:complete